MITAALTNPTVRAAMEALQRGDRHAWAALLEPGAELYDDGKPRGLAALQGSTACGMRSRTRIGSPDLDPFLFDGLNQVFEPERHVGDDAINEERRGHACPATPGAVHVFIHALTVDLILSSKSKRSRSSSGWPA